MTWRVRWICLFVLINFSAAAEDPQTPPPALELIDFLGSFTTEDGEWVDPLGLIGDDAYLQTGLPEEQVQEGDDEQKK